MLSRYLNQSVNLVLVILFWLMVAIGCSDSGGGSDNPVPNTSPTAVITSPVDGVIYDEGDYITFAGTCDDNEEDSLTGNAVVWTSSKDGHINYGTSFTENDLSTGTHIITLVATDSGGASSSASVAIAVNPAGNEIPTAEITNPSDQDEFDEGENISFTGTGNDAEDGALSGGDLVWRSSIDGVIGTGGSVSDRDLSLGTHTISLTATDSADVFGTDIITITISSSSGTATYDNNATGTYNYNSSTGALNISFTTTNIPICCWPYSTFSATATVGLTTMDLEIGTSSMTWNRDGGTSGDIVGTWRASFDGTNHELTFNSDGSCSHSSDCLTNNGNNAATFSMIGNYCGVNYNIISAEACSRNESDSIGLHYFYDSRHIALEIQSINLLASSTTFDIETDNFILEMHGELVADCLGVDESIDASSGTVVIDIYTQDRLKGSFDVFFGGDNLKGSFDICLSNCSGLVNNPYFNFYIGNEYTQDVNPAPGSDYESRTTVHTITGTTVIEDEQYYIFNTDEIFVDRTRTQTRYMREDTLGNIWVVSDDTGVDPILFLKYPFNVGDTNTLDGFGTQTIVSNTDTVTVVGGTFTDCVKIHINWDDPDLGSGHMWLGKDVGFFLKEENDARSEQLESAMVDGISYP